MKKLKLFEKQNHTHTHTHTQEKNKQTHIILSISEFESGVIILKEIRQTWIFFKENYENKKKIVFLFPLFFLALLGIYFSLPASHVLYYLLRHFSCVQFFVTPWMTAHLAPLSMGFSRQEYRMGCHFLLQGIFLTQGSSLCLLHWQTDSLPLHHLGRPVEEHGKVPSDTVQTVNPFPHPLLPSVSCWGPRYNV